MAKLSGFFMSTLLILLCLWINICHYPNAANGTASDGGAAPPVDVVPQSVSPASEPVDAPAVKEEPTRPSGLLADSGVGGVPELLGVSASRPNAAPVVDPATVPPVLSPASFPVDGAEINDAPAETAPVKPESPLPPVTFGVSKSLSPTPNPATPTSRAVATPAQDVRRSASKPRGAKYVRVPDVEIDAFSGGVRTARSSDDEPRVVGATRVGQTASVVPSVSYAP